MAEGVCAGVDWAKDTHEVLVSDGAGERLWSETVRHDAVGIDRLCRTLAALGVQRVALERPDGLLVERLLDAGLRVLALPPNQVAAARPRFRSAGGKSDRFDAFVLCELARIDHDSCLCRRRHNHDLRHTFGTRCAAAGVPLRTLQAWMGHADIKTTMVYTHYAPGANEAELVNGVFGAEGIKEGIKLSTTAQVADPQNAHEIRESA